MDAREKREKRGKKIDEKRKKANAKDMSFATTSRTRDDRKRPGLGAANVYLERNRLGQTLRTPGRHIASHKSIRSQNLSAPHPRRYLIDVLCGAMMASWRCSPVLHPTQENAGSPEGVPRGATGHGAARPCPVFTMPFPSNTRMMAPKRDLPRLARALYHQSTRNMVEVELDRLC